MEKMLPTFELFRFSYLNIFILNIFISNGYPMIQFGLSVLSPLSSSIIKKLTLLHLLRVPKSNLNSIKKQPNVSSDVCFAIASNCIDREFKAMNRHTAYSYKRL